jgi:hypothetical protein
MNGPFCENMNFSYEKGGVGGVKKGAPKFLKKEHISPFN